MFLFHGCCVEGPLAALEGLLRSPFYLLGGLLLLLTAPCRREPRAAAARAGWVSSVCACVWRVGGGGGGCVVVWKCARGGFRRRERGVCRHPTSLPLHSIYMHLTPPTALPSTCTYVHTFVGCGSASLPSSPLRGSRFWSPAWRCLPIETSGPFPSGMWHVSGVVCMSVGGRVGGGVKWVDVCARVAIPLEHVLVSGEDERAGGRRVYIHPFHSTTIPNLPYAHTLTSISIHTHPQPSPPSWAQWTPADSTCSATGRAPWPEMPITTPTSVGSVLPFFGGGGGTKGGADARDVCHTVCLYVGGYGCGWGKCVHPLPTAADRPAHTCYPYPNHQIHHLGSMDALALGGDSTKKTILHPPRRLDIARAFGTFCR